MDLFTKSSSDFTILADLSAKVDEVGDFVAAISERELKILENFLKGRDFNNWEKAVRNAQGFAYEQGLRENWWEIVRRLDEKRRESFWTPAWDCAYDYAVALLLKPWAGITWPAKDQETLIAPLRHMGLTVY